MRFHPFIWYKNPENPWSNDGDEAAFSCGIWSRLMLLFPEYSWHLLVSEVALCTGNLGEKENEEKSHLLLLISSCENLVHGLVNGDVRRGWWIVRCLHTREDLFLFFVKINLGKQTKLIPNWSYLAKFLFILKKLNLRGLKTHFWILWGFSFSKF